MSFPKFHTNPVTNEVRRCRARYNCRFGSASSHHPSRFDALAAVNREKLRLEYADKQLEKGAVSPISADLVRQYDYTIKPGEYLLCDPYILIATKDQAGWNDIVASIDSQFSWENEVSRPDDEKQVAVGVNYRGQDLGIIKQWHGKGLYWSMGPINRIPSDSGLLGTISRNTVEEMGYSIDSAVEDGLGVKVVVDNDTKVWRDENGVTIVGGKNLIGHNDLVADLFESLSSVSGDGDRKNKKATEKTYANLTERAAAWRENPSSIFKAFEVRAERAGVA